VREHRQFCGLPTYARSFVGAALLNLVTVFPINKGPDFQTTDQLEVVGEIALFRGLRQALPPFSSQQASVLDERLRLFLQGGPSGRPFGIRAKRQPLFLGVAHQDFMMVFAKTRRIFLVDARQGNIFTRDGVPHGDL
jgi:hypothetical protein